MHFDPTSGPFLQETSPWSGLRGKELHCMTASEMKSILGTFFISTWETDWEKYQLCLVDISLSMKYKTLER